MEIRYSKAALKALLRSNKRKLIESKINELGVDQLTANPNVTKLVGREEYRLRVQDWRVIFCVDGTILSIERIGPRGPSTRIERMTAQFVEIAGAKMVLLTREEFERMSEAADSYSDIVAAVEAQKRHESGEEYVPAEVVAKLVAGENPLKVWRKYRGLTQDALAELTGCQKAFISKLETGRSEGGVKLWQALAQVLNVDIDDLIVPAN